MNKYPYIGQGVSDPELVVYFTRPREGIVLGLGRKILCKVNDYFDAWVEGNFKDITKEYITNKKMQVLHEEHAKQINEMAARYGFSSLSDRSIASAKHIYFNEDAVTYSGKDDGQYFKEHPYHQIELPFIDYIEKPSEHEEVMNDPEDEITKLEDKIAELEKELSDHKCNTEQLLKLTDYISTNKNITGVVGKKSVDVAIELLEEWDNWEGKSEIQKVEAIINELRLLAKASSYKGNGYDNAVDCLVGVVEWLKNQEEMASIKVGEYGLARNYRAAGRCKVVATSEKDVCVVFLCNDKLTVIEKKNFIREGSASK